jgi:hypothetical protein
MCAKSQRRWAIKDDGLALASKQALSHAWKTKISQLK